VDIFKTGSGNIGATNVMRTLGRKAGISVFVLDVLKGFVPPILAYQMKLGQDSAFFAGIASVLGHIFSPFLRFKGGKGIATSLGALLGSVPATAATAFAIFLAIVVAWRYISLGSVVAAFLAPILSYAYGDSLVVTIGLIPMAALLIWKHRANIVRLRSGTESKFTFGKREPASGNPEVPENTS
jgi:glycerol-3-phosphate acyltransferase PlsY